MISIISCPAENGLYGLKNVPALKFFASGQTSLTLDFNDSEGEQVHFSGSYTPNSNGIVEVDVADVIESAIGTEVKIANSYEQGDFKKLITIGITDEVSNMTKHFYVLNINCKTTGLQQILKERFLTLQPDVKYTTMDAPEFISHYSADSNNVLKVKFHKTNGTKIVTLANCQQGAAYTYNVSPKRMVALSELDSNQLKTYYDVYVENNGNIKCSQRYVIKTSAQCEKYYVFENKMGGFDTMIFKGIRNVVPEVTYNTARLASKLIQLDDTDDSITYEQFSGYMYSIYKNWINDFLMSKKQKYHYDSKLKKIVITSSELTCNDRDAMSTFKFSYKYADGDVETVSQGTVLPEVNKIVYSKNETVNTVSDL